MSRTKGSVNKATRDTQLFVADIIAKYKLKDPLEIGLITADEAYKAMKEIKHTDGTLATAEGRQAIKTVSDAVKTVLPYCHHQLRNIVITEEALEGKSIEDITKAIHQRINNVGKSK